MGRLSASVYLGGFPVSLGRGWGRPISRETPICAVCVRKTPRAVWGPIGAETTPPIPLRGRGRPPAGIEGLGDGLVAGSAEGLQVGSLEAEIGPQGHRLDMVYLGGRDSLTAGRMGPTVRLGRQDGAAETLPSGAIAPGRGTAGGLAPCPDTPGSGAR